jgi:DivIVA domain-containing protein
LPTRESPLTEGGITQQERSSGSKDQGRGFRDLRHYVPPDILDVSFPVAVRGYERHAVDAYIQRVNRTIAELKISGSPPAAVRHALDQAEEKVEELLRAAREAGEQITTSARREAEESTARSKAEAADLLVDSNAEAERVRAEAGELLAKARAEANTIVSDATAEAAQIIERSQADADERLRRSNEEVNALRDRAETQMRELESDTDAVWEHRRELLDDIGAMATGLFDIAKTAAERLPPPPQDSEDELDEVDGSTVEADAATLISEPDGRL